MRRTALLAGVLALYGAVLGRGPAGRAIGKAGFDPLAPQPAAVEQLIVARRFAEALPLASQVHASYPGEPLPSYWLATINHELARWAEEADAWTAYVGTSAAPAVACPAWPDADQKSGRADRAAAADLRCRQLVQR